MATCELVLTPAEMSSRIAISLYVVSCEPSKKKAPEDKKEPQQITKVAALTKLARELYSLKKKSNDPPEQQQERETGGEDLESRAHDSKQDIQPETPHVMMKTSEAQTTPRVEIPRKRSANSPGSNPSPSKQNRISSSRLSRYEQHDVGDLGKPILHTASNRTSPLGTESGALNATNCPEISPIDYFQKSGKASSSSHPTGETDMEIEQRSQDAEHPPRATPRKRDAISSIPSPLPKSSQNTPMNKERSRSPMFIPHSSDERPFTEGRTPEHTANTASNMSTATKHDDPWQGRTRIHYRDVHIIRDQQELLEDQSSWIPAAPACVTPKAYVPPFLLKQWNDAYANWKRHGSIESQAATTVPGEQAKPANSKSQESGDTVLKVASGNTDPWGSLGDSTLLDALSVQNASGETAYIASQQRSVPSGEKTRDTRIPEKSPIPDDDNNDDGGGDDDNDDDDDDLVDGISVVAEESSSEASEAAEGAAVDELGYYSLNDDSSSSSNSGGGDNEQDDYPPSSNPAPPDTPPPPPPQPLPAKFPSPASKVVSQQTSASHDNGPSDDPSNEDDNEDDNGDVNEDVNGDDAVSYITGSFSAKFDIDIVNIDAVDTKSLLRPHTSQL